MNQRGIARSPKTRAALPQAMWQIINAISGFALRLPEFTAEKQHGTQVEYFARVAEKQFPKMYGLVLDYLSTQEGMAEDVIQEFKKQAANIPYRQFRDPQQMDEWIAAFSKKQLLFLQQKHRENNAQKSFVALNVEPSLKPPKTGSVHRRL